MVRTNVLLSVFIAGLFASVAFANGACDGDCRTNYLTPGRALMFNNSLSGLRQAYQKFDDGTKDAACNGCRELRFLHALTGTAMLFIDNENADLDSFLELAEVFGVTVVGDLVEELQVEVAKDPDGCYRLPEDAPDPEDVLDTFSQEMNDSMVPAIDDIIADLDAITEPVGDLFTIYFTPGETGLENNLEVDYGEVLVLKALLHAFKSLLQAQTPYDIYLKLDWDLLRDLLREQGICPDTEITEADLLDFFNLPSNPENISINTHFLERYPNLLKVLPTSGHPQDGAAILAKARQDLINGINKYFAALDYIKSEEDPQEDDLLYIDEGVEFGLSGLNERLTAVRDNLQDGTIMTLPIERTEVFNVKSGGDQIGQLELVYNTADLTRTGGRDGNLTFSGGPVTPPEWRIEEFGVDVGGSYHLWADLHTTDGDWRWGWFDAVLDDDRDSFSDGTFEYQDPDWNWQTLTDLTGERERVSTSVVDVNVNPIFGTSPPVAPRNMLPRFDSNNRIIEGTFGHGLGDDPTLGGILPDMTQGMWTALLGLPMPDLVGEFVSTTLPSPATFGDKGNVKITVKNQGEHIASGKIKIDVYASADQTLDDGDKLIGSVSNRTIALKHDRSKAFNVGVTIPSDLAQGWYYLLAYVDSADKIGETNEENNVAASAHFELHVKWPDLVGAVTHTFKEPAAAGDAAKVRVTVTNQGTVLAKGKINVEVYLSADQTLDVGDKLVRTLANHPINLKAGKFVTLQISVTLPGQADLAPGDYYVLAKVDSTNVIPEDDETNNVAVSSDDYLLTVERPDLVGTITHTFRDPAALGAKAKVKVVVRNQGNVRAKGRIKIDVYASGDQLLDGGDTWLNAAVNKSINLKPTKSESFTISVTLPLGLAPGEYYFLANVDSDNAILESDESNNVAPTAATLTVQ